MYTSGQITTILNSALSTLYRLQNQVERERYMQGDDRLTNQPLLIFSLYQSVSWGQSKGLTTDEFYGQVAYLYSKVDKAVAGLAGVTVPDLTSPGETADSSSLIYIWEYLIPAAPVSGLMSNGDTLWVNENFVNRTLEVEYGNIPVSGVETTDGSIYFLKPFASNELRFYNLPGGVTTGALIKVRAWATGS